MRKCPECRGNDIIRYMACKYYNNLTRKESGFECLDCMTEFEIVRTKINGKIPELVIPNRKK